MSGEAFLKMHGLGNDFVVFDRRNGGPLMSEAGAAQVADRRTGIGADQVITLLASDDADVFMQIHNADGGEVAACGNATRCVARVLFDELGRDVSIRTKADLLLASVGVGGVAVDMGVPGLNWQDIPLIRDMDTLSLDLKSNMDARLENPVAVSMGNPHAIFFVKDVDDVDIQAIGPALEHDALFPERANINVATVQSDNSIRLRVWERGVGLTLACGTGACATLVAAVRRGLTDRSVTLVLDGGELAVTWAEDDHVIMEGPATTSFAGVWDWDQ